MPKILITGAAGFIGYSLIKKILLDNYDIVGIDNINDYYSVQLKVDRLIDCGIEIDNNNIEFNEIFRSKQYSNYSFVKMNIEDKESLFSLFETEKFDVVINLAAQAGVRYSLENPDAYIQSNIVGFINILEACRHFEIKHLIYASSSSVYGLNTKIPFSVDDNVTSPASLYAATKRSDELMAFAYSHLFKFPTTGLRFFTVYGPWGRPDMAYYLFTESILNNKPINVFNHGNLMRDFTYIDDIVSGIKNIVNQFEKNKLIAGDNLSKIYNIGNNKPVKLLDFIKTIESHLNKKASFNMLEMQKGDVHSTWADIDELVRDYDYNPSTDINEGLYKFIEWFKKYYNK